MNIRSVKHIKATVYGIINFYANYVTFSVSFVM